jgi:hypothetical protein
VFFLQSGFQHAIEAGTLEREPEVARAAPIWMLIFAHAASDLTALPMVCWNVEFTVALK